MPITDSLGNTYVYNPDTHNIDVVPASGQGYSIIPTSYGEGYIGGGSWLDKAVSIIGKAVSKAVGGGSSPLVTYPGLPITGMPVVSASPGASQDPSKIFLPDRDPASMIPPTSEARPPSFTVAYILMGILGLLFIWKKLKK